MSPPPVLTGTYYFWVSLNVTVLPGNSACLCMCARVTVDYC